jgi:hypothetical protein
MVMVQNFEAMSNKFYIDRICSKKKKTVSTYLYLFNNAVSSSDYTILNGRTICELERTWNDVVMV